jgi:hypothetical protein
MDFSTMDGATVSSITAVGGSLAAAITAVYRRLTTKLDACEERHEEAIMDLRNMAERVGRLEGRIEAKSEGDP